MAGRSSLLVFLAVLAACDGDDTPSNVLPDAAKIEDATLPRAKLTLVHASPNLPSVRVCFAQGSKPDGSDAVLLDTAPAPDSGLAPRSALALPSLGDLSRVLVPFVVLASKAPARCPGLTSSGLIPGGDFHRLPPLPEGVLSGAPSILLALTGCLGTTFDPSASADRCGADFSALSGNLALRALELDARTRPGTLGAQLAHLAPTVGAVAAGLASAPDASSVFFTTIAPTVRYGELKPTPAATLVLPDPNAIVRVAAADAGEFTFPLPPGINNGTHATFALVGEITDGGALSIIAIPSDPK